MNKLRIRSARASDITRLANKKHVIPLYRLLVELSAKEGSTYTTLDDIASLMGASKRTVFNQLELLQKMALIVKIGHGRAGTEILIVDTRQLNSAIRQINSETVELNLSKIELNPELNSATSAITSTKGDLIQRKKDRSPTKRDLVRHTNVTKKSYLPNLPISIKTLSLTKYKLTDKTDVVGYCVWYWLINRYKLHNIDEYVTELDYLKFYDMFQTKVLPVIGSNLDDLKDYIDWYLTQKGPFFRQTLCWNIFYLVSDVGMRAFLSVKPTRKKTFIREEERETTEGVWIK